MGNCMAKQKKHKDKRERVYLADNLEMQQPNSIQISQTLIRTVLNPSIQLKDLEIKPATSNKLQSDEQIFLDKPIVRGY